jgi:mitofilin
MELTTARVKGLSEALSGSAVYETESRKAQELALACDSLLHVLKYGNDGKPVPLSKQIETVRQVCAGDETVETLTGAFSNIVSSRGVYTEDTLRTSFKQVGHLCRQVSLVDEEHNSLFVYFLSYLKNVLTFAPSTTAPPEEVDVTNLNPYNIVAYANYCLQSGDLEQAARFVNQLKGESRKVAEEWLLEARLLIETKQTTQALNMVSNAFVIAAQLSE